jgi:hypothetical protein
MVQAIALSQVRRSLELHQQRGFDTNLLPTSTHAGIVGPTASRHQPTPGTRAPTDGYDHIARDVSLDLHSCMNLAMSRPAICLLAILAGCAPPTDVIDLHQAPQATRDAMLHVGILPLGTPAPPGVGSVGPVSAYGCGPSPADAASDAVQQLQAKALRMQATAVIDVLFGPGGIGPCQLGYSATASGIAASPRGVPPTY